MANTDAPFGFRPAYHATGGQIRAQEYEIADAYNTAIYPGDWVKLVTAGTIERAAATNVDLLGVFQGCHFTKSNGEKVWSKIWPASQALLTGTVAKASVVVDPNVVYLAQFDGSGTPDLAGIGALYDIVATAGNATLECSREDVNASGGTSDGQVRLIGYLEDGNNDRTATFAIGYFQVNEHSRAAAVAGI